MLTIDTLRTFGARVDEGLARCVNDEDFYLMLVQMAMEDQRLPELEAAITANNPDTAFEIAHALKGIYGNVSLTPIFEPVSALTELLRQKADADYLPLLEEAKQQYQRLADMIAE